MGAKGGLNIPAVIMAHERSLVRRTGGFGTEYVLRMRRSFEAPVAKVWHSLSTPERIRHWFLPVSGDFRTGGSYQLEGNAGGDILRCERPRLLQVTFGDPDSVVTITLAARGDGGTDFELEHAAVTAMAEADYLADLGNFAPGWEAPLVMLEKELQGEFRHRLASELYEDDWQLWAVLGHIWTDLARAMFAAGRS